jgi:hypothetical protein
MNPARTNSFWLAISDSAGASRKVWLNKWLIRMVCSFMIATM